MKCRTTEVPGVRIVEPVIHRDARGFFFECYHARKLAEGGIHDRFVQDNHSLSRGPILRGLHAQRRRPQAKLVRVLRGEIYDVAVDIRRDAPTFRRFVAVHLSAENGRMLYVPRGFAHGFAVLSPEAEVTYKCSDFYAPEDEITVAWNDPELAIPWPLAEPILSPKDGAAPPLSALMAELPTLA